MRIKKDLKIDTNDIEKHIALLNFKKYYEILDDNDKRKHKKFLELETKYGLTLYDIKKYVEMLRCDDNRLIYDKKYCKNEIIKFKNKYGELDDKYKRIKNILLNDFYKQPHIYNLKECDISKSKNRRLKFIPIDLHLRFTFNYNFKSTYDNPNLTAEDKVYNKVNIAEGNTHADYGNLKVVKYNKKNWVNNNDGIYEVKDNEYYTTNDNMNLLNDRNDKIDSKIKKVKKCESIAEEVATDFINKIVDNVFIGININIKKYDTAHQTFFNFYKFNPYIQEDNLKCDNDYNTKRDEYYDSVVMKDEDEAEDEYMKLNTDANSIKNHNGIYENSNIKKYEKRKNQILNNDWNRYNSDYRMECLFNFDYFYDDDDSISNYIIDDSEHLDYGDE